MGCFGSKGFYSGLPITYGIPTVLFIYYGYSGSGISSPVYATDLMSPLFLPLIGRYDDYGGIEDICNPSVLQGILDTTGISGLDSLLSGISRCSGDTLGSGILDRSDADLFQAEFSDVVKVLELLVKSSIVDTSGLDSGRYYLAIGLERLDVYQAMCSMSSTPELESKFNRIIELREKYNITDSILGQTNVLRDFSDSLLDSLASGNATEAGERIDTYKVAMSDMMDLDILISDFDPGYSRYRLIPLQCGDIIQKDWYDLLCFNLTLHRMSGYYTVSPLAHQCIGEPESIEMFKELHRLSGFILDSYDKETD